MKVFKTVLLLCILCVPVFANAKSASQQDEVTLTVSADGATKDEAVKTALRSAIEQAYGTFVSANTAILNDELVKDEIVTVASGNVKSYSEIASETMPNGRTYVTLRATVSVSKLIKYAQSKGAETEFAGATFGMNLKMKELNRQNEQKVLENMKVQLKSIHNFFDYEMKLGEPKILNNNQDMAYVDGYITLIFNENAQLYYDILLKTLFSVSLSNDELREYRNTGLSFYKLKIESTLNPHKPTKYYSSSWKTSDLIFYLRNPFDMSFFETNDLSKIAWNEFVISDNISSPTKLKYEISFTKFTEPFYMLTKEKTSIGGFFSAALTGGDIGGATTVEKRIGQEIKLGEKIGGGRIRIYIPVSEISKYSTFKISPKTIF